MRHGYQCSSPWHVGDRFIASRFDVFERRIEFRRRSDQGRERVIATGDVCRECMKAEITDRGAAGPTTEPLFHN